MDGNRFFNALKNRIVNYCNKSSRSILLFFSAIFTAISYITLWIQSFYFQNPTSEIISAKVHDTWCPTFASGIGSHCFSDYQTPVLALKMLDPWANGVNYPASALLIFKPFSLLGDIVDTPNVGLFSYLIVCSLALLSAALWAGHNAPYDHLLIFLIFGCMSTPFLGAVDRGNSVAFLVPIFLIYAIGIFREQWWRVVLAITFASLIKPQYILMLLPLIGLRKWKYVFTILKLVGTFSLMCWWMLADSPTKAFINWVQNSSSYQSRSLDIGGSNISFSQGITSIVSILEEHVLHMRPVTAKFIAEHTNFLNLIILVTITSAVYLCGTKLSRFQLVVVGLSIPSLIISNTAYYYQVFALVIAALILRCPLQNGSNDSRNEFALQGSVLSQRKITNFFVIAATVNSCVNMPIGIDILGLNNVAERSSISRLFVPILWLIVLILTFLEVIHKRKPPPSSARAFKVL